MEYGDQGPSATTWTMKTIAGGFISITKSFYGNWKRQKELGQSDLGGYFWMRHLRGKGGNWGYTVLTPGVIFLF